MAELRRLYAPPEDFADGSLALAGERLRHVRTVLRLGPGDEIAATDGAGGEYRLRIERIGRDAGSALVLERAEPRRESPLRTILAQAIPRGDRFELVLEKAVELGVTGVIPVLSGRTVRATRAEAGVARWRRIVEGALAQCGRTRLPAVSRPLSLEELLVEPGLPALRILLHEAADAGLTEAIERFGEGPAPRSVLVAVGPEGGWSPSETQLARDAGFITTRLGPRVLRSETAGIAAVAVLQHRWGDLG